MQLADRLIDKQEDAIMELIDIYGNYLIRTAYLLVKDYQTAEEVVQDTFVIAIGKISQLQDPTKLKSWLTSIVMNCCRSRMRKWSWKNILLSFDNDQILEEDSSQSAETELMEAIRNESLSEAIQELDYKYREVITLYYFNEMKISEISEVIKEKESTIKSRLKRARLNLKNNLMKGEELHEEYEKRYKKPTR
ncbi:RNA polymerase sigma factor [Ornithinibacillus scapharcae]|uniref:RNA polymerase sigma factor n=1 Tax=Ornithinibacillus scapharcae TaxID=1147159 RepID=UPI000225BC35|nr:sigma-70 family RNA polymerase sigma factor [Ornithinibacillus scapharcae]